MSQTITALSEDLIQHMQEQRDWVYGSFSFGENTGKPPADADTKLRLLQAIIDTNTIQPDETWKLQCLGIVLGDILVEKLGLAWVEVRDEYGDDPAVASADHKTLFFTLTMISKRIEQGENVDIMVLFNFCKAHHASLQNEQQ